MNQNVEKFNYDNRIVWYFTIASIIFGLVGMSYGVIIAIQLYAPGFNLASYFTFGRIRPLHTNAVIFAFVGNAIFAGVYYSLQRLLKTRMYSDKLSKLHFWGWQFIILCAAITLPLGITTGHEYAELEWWIDILIALIWVTFGVNMIGTIIIRRVTHMYVAIWFYIATFVAVALLHIVNSFEVPVSFFKSYYLFAGVQDALVQWWYGHNAVAFFLTTPYLGLMYYLIPKASDRPVYSYKLSLVHFWSLVFIYIWAGPHHLLYSSLPEWAQSLGTVFSIMLIAPSWGGMLNGLLTLRGAWDKVREEPVLKFLVVAVTCYGMATFEGPMLALKSVNAIGHFTDWVPAHVHVGTLGWNGFLTFGMFYWLVPRLFGTQLYSKKLANAHFWIGILGIVFWVIPMYFAGFTQGLMWKEFTEDGLLKYGNFLETVTQIIPMYILRSVGGTLYLTGFLLLIYNIIMTVRSGKLLSDEAAEFPKLEDHGAPTGKYAWHAIIEQRPVQMLILTLLLLLSGTVVELVPTFLIDSNIKTISSVKPYTPLELEGRDLYIREGCNSCHTQWVRPFRSETERYGEFSKAGEFVYDHPFLWGSKRTGPDLHRVGRKYPDSWHYNHMNDPSSTSPGSIMPKYGWLIENDLNISLTKSKVLTMKQMGVPYQDGYENRALDDLKTQASAIQANLKKDKINVDSGKEIIALIAYLQRLGTDIKPKDHASN